MARHISYLEICKDSKLKLILSQRFILWSCIRLQYFVKYLTYGCATTADNYYNELGALKYLLTLKTDVLKKLYRYSFRRLERPRLDVQNVRNH